MVIWIQIWIVPWKKSCLIAASRRLVSLIHMEVLHRGSCIPAAAPIKMFSSLFLAASPSQTDPRWNIKPLRGHGQPGLRLKLSWKDREASLPGAPCQVLKSPHYYHHPYSFVGHALPLRPRTCRAKHGSARHRTEPVPQKLAGQHRMGLPT